jgi:ribosome-binding protein aMBF1 (putative translation factor)
VIVQEEERVIMECEFCGKAIVGSKWNKEYHHINVCQAPEKRFFCSRQCKLRWVFKVTSF